MQGGGREDRCVLRSSAVSQGLRGLPEAVGPEMARFRRPAPADKRLKPPSAPGPRPPCGGPLAVHTQRKSDNSLRARSRWQLKRRTLGGQSNHAILHASSLMAGLCPSALGWCAEGPRPRLLAAASHGPAWSIQGSVQIRRGRFNTDSGRPNLRHRPEHRATWSRDSSGPGTPADPGGLDCDVDPSPRGSLAKGARRRSLARLQSSRRLRQPISRDEGRLSGCGRGSRGVVRFLARCP